MMSACAGIGVRRSCGDRSATASASSLSSGSDGRSKVPGASSWALAVAPPTSLALAVPLPASRFARSSTLLTRLSTSFAIWSPRVPKRATIRAWSFSSCVVMRFSASLAPRAISPSV